VKSTASGNSIATELDKIRSRESQFPPIEDSTIVETAKEAQNAQPLYGVKDAKRTSVISS